MDIILICVTAIIVTGLICYSFGTNLKPETEYIYKEVEPENKEQATEDEELENALVTSLGEINNLFGGVENDED